MSALRLGETNRKSVKTRPTAEFQHQVVNSQQPTYGYPNKVTELRYEPEYGVKNEGIYANLEELTASSMSSIKYQETFIPPPEQFSQRLMQISHVPTQSKVSLEEAMRYTPPNLVSSADEAPVYENIQFYTSPKKTLLTTSSNNLPCPSYQPVASNLAPLKTDEHFAMQQPFEPTHFPPPASMKCKSFSPSYPAPQIIKPSPQRFSQAIPTYPQSQHTTSVYDKSQRVIRQAGNNTILPVQSSTTSSSPKMPLATLPSRKVCACLCKSS